MAIKIGGTTVIDDSRNLSSVGGLKTVGGTSILGSGNIDAGASTDVNGVGTYTLAYDTGMDSGSSFKVYKEGRTVAGSALRQRAAVAQPNANNEEGVATSTSGTSASFGSQNSGYNNNGVVSSNQGYSGSWRLMSPGANTSNDVSSGWGVRYTALWVRYS